MGLKEIYLYVNDLFCFRFVYMFWFVYLYVCLLARSAPRGAPPPPAAYRGGYDAQGSYDDDGYEEDEPSGYAPHPAPMAGRGTLPCDVMSHQLSRLVRAGPFR